MPLPLLIVLIVSGVVAGTYLAVESAFPPFKIPRDFLITRLDPRDAEGNKTREAPLGGLGRSFAYLLGCSWCTSAWMSWLVIYLTEQQIPVPLPWLVAATAFVSTGTFAQWRAWRHETYRLTVLECAVAEDDLKKRGWKVPNNT